MFSQIASQDFARNAHRASAGLAITIGQMHSEVSTWSTVIPSSFGVLISRDMTSSDASFSWVISIR